MAAIGQKPDFSEQLLKHVIHINVEFVQFKVNFFDCIVIGVNQILHPKNVGKSSLSDLLNFLELLLESLSLTLKYIVANLLNVVFIKYDSIIIQTKHLPKSKLIFNTYKFFINILNINFK
jgi:hypothetical protein